MKQLLFWTSLSIIGLLILAKIQIQFKPFKVSFGDLIGGFGWLFIFLSIICFRLSSYREGNKEGYKKALQDVEKEISKLQSVFDK